MIIAQMPVDDEQSKCYDFFDDSRRADTRADGAVYRIAPQSDPTSVIFGQPRATVYVDGFNLYYGSLRGTPYKWLNLQYLFTSLRPNESIKRIWYFTAPVKGETKPNQMVYWQALATTPLVEVVEGKFKDKRVECKHKECPGKHRRFFSSQEEKRTDVSIGIHMLDDAYQNVSDKLILVTGDSDLCPAVERVRSRFPKKQVIVYVPSRDEAGDTKRKYNTELRSVATSLNRLPPHLLKLSQFPDPLVTTWGVLVKPEAWNHADPKPTRPVEFNIHASCRWCGRTLAAIQATPD